MKRRSFLAALLGVPAAAASAVALPRVVAAADEPGRLGSAHGTWDKPAAGSVIMVQVWGTGGSGGFPGGHVLGGGGGGGYSSIPGVGGGGGGGGYSSSSGAAGR